MATSSKYHYQKSLIHQFWDYAEAEWTLEQSVLDSYQRNERRPPVFRKESAAENILVPPNSNPETYAAVESILPSSERHVWFRSMKSSQALAQSVFGNLIVSGNLDLLIELETEQGLPAFCDDLGTASSRLEYGVNYLGEVKPRLTSVDVLFSGSSRIAVECKLTEPDFGTCSRPRLREGKDSNYLDDHCTGSYTRQRGRHTRCSLTEIGIRYWDYVPSLFNWDGDVDIEPCPLSGNYQLVRNVLAACVTPDGTIDTKNAHVLVIYDARNPSFQIGGVANDQWRTAKAALRQPELLRSCSWQSLVAHLDKSRNATWLVSQLRKKYGF